MPKETIGEAEVIVKADGRGFSKDLGRQIRASEPAVKTASERVGNESHKSFQEGWVKGSKRDGTLADAIEKDFHAGASKFNADGEDIGKIFTDGFRKKMQEGFGKDIGGKMFDNIKKDVESGAQSLDSLGVRFQNLRRDVARAEADIKKSGSGISGRLHSIADGIGKAFGKGSRNNFLNFFGSFVSVGPHLFASITDALPKARDAIMGFFADFNQAWKDASSNGQKSIGGLIQAIGGFASEGVVGLAIAAGGMVVAVNGFVFILGVAAAAVSLLAGAILALAGAIGFALVGALAAVGGALIPFGAAQAVAAIGLSGLMSKGSDLIDFKKDWDKLQSSIQRDMFGKDKQAQLNTLRSLLNAVKPVILAVATALGSIIKAFEKATQTKGFQKMMQDISKMLGPMVKTLGDIAGHLADFLGNAFIDAGPFIKAFLGGLDDIAKRLDNFSKGGKKSGLAKFFNDAWDSAQKVWRLIKDVALVLGDLFGAGRTHGDNIITGLAQSAEDLHKWLSDPKNAKTLDQWFQDAEKLAGELGKIVVAAGEFIAALDTPLNRTILFWILDHSAALLDFLSKAVGWVDQMQQKTLATVDNLGKVGDKIATQIGKGDIGGAAQTAAANPVVQTLAPVPSLLVNAFHDVGPQVLSALGDFGVMLDSWISSGIAQIPGLISQIVGFFTGLGVKIITAAGSLVDAFTTWISGIVSAIPGVITQIISFFVGLPGKIIIAAGDLAGQFGTWLAGLPVAVITTVGQIIVGFIGLAGRIITAAGDVIGGFTQWLADLPGAALRAIADVIGVFVGLAPRIIAAAGDLIGQFRAWISGLPGQIRALAVQIASGFVGLAGRIITAAGNLAGQFGSWIAALPGRARSLAQNIVSAFVGMAGRAINAAGSLISSFGRWVAGLPGAARGIVRQIVSAFSGLASDIVRGAGNLVSQFRTWASGVGTAASGVANDIVNAFSGLGSRIANAIGTIIPTVSLPTLAELKHRMGLASGGVVMGPTQALIGEAGPEAVVPLARPLSQVDPAVRALSAIAQGMFVGSGQVANTGKTIDVGGITVITPTQDPRAVASEVIARMASVAYI
jgi:phage-related protein